VGEIRDNETAELAIHAALTGHLVFSTVHTNDCIGTIPRLIDMGIEPFLLSSSLRVVAAQRLVRCICDYCKEKVSLPLAISEQVRKELKIISPEDLSQYDISSLEQIDFYQGKGCEECGKLGYKGRLAIFEAMEVDKDVQEIISSQRDSESALRKLAEKKGFVSMRQDGLIKVIKGMTTLSEVERVTESSFSIGGDMEDDRG